MARSKIKRTKDCYGCDNNIHRDNNLLQTNGVSQCYDKVNQDNFDCEDSNNECHEHGLSKKSYKASGNINSYLNKAAELLNKGKRIKRRTGLDIRTLNIEHLIRRH